MTDKSVATLVRGTLYVLAGRSIGTDVHFHKDIGIVVSAEQREHLEATAIDEIRGEVDPDTGSFEIIAKAKFHYADYEGPLKPGDRAEAVIKKSMRTVQATPLRKKKVS